MVRKYACAPFSHLVKKRNCKEREAKEITCRAYLSTLRIFEGSRSFLTLFSHFAPNRYNLLLHAQKTLLMCITHHCARLSPTLRSESR